MPCFQISETLLIRTLAISDATELYNLVDNNRIYLRQWLPWLDVNVSVKDSEEFIAATLDQHSRGLGFQCGMFVNAMLVGMVGYHPINRTSSTVVIGYWLAENMQGQGLVTNCVEFLTSYAFNDLNIKKVCIPVAEGNAASRAVAERLDFVNEGVERQAENLYGRYVNHVRYSILNDEWKACIAKNAT